MPIEHHQLIPFKRVRTNISPKFPGDTLIDMTIDVNNNTLTNIDNSNIKANAGIEISKLESIACSICSGSYIGDDTINRAIPHGLGKKPKFVNLHNINFGAIMIQTENIDFILYMDNNGSERNNVTVANNTHFYVGALGHLFASANQSGESYAWEAFG